MKRNNKPALASLLVGGGVFLAGVVAPPKALAATCAMGDWFGLNCVLVEGEKTVTAIDLNEYACNNADSVSLISLEGNSCSLNYLFGSGSGNNQIGTFGYDISVLAPGCTFSTAIANITAGAAPADPVFFANLASPNFSGTSTAGSSSTCANPGNSVSFDSGISRTAFNQYWDSTNTTGFASIAAVGFSFDRKYLSDSPAPLPVMWAAAAFGFSRKMRNRIKQSA